MICNTRLSLSLGDNTITRKSSHDQESLVLQFTNSNMNPMINSSVSAAVSSFSNSSVKRERDSTGLEDEDVELEMDKSDHEFGRRKKLRLTKDQSAVLEDSFKDHTTLNSKQKQELATRLTLRPRQVEVWFQNRRARTKLKQTEVDCEVLRKCYEDLKDENRRLYKELEELKAVKMAGLPFRVQLSAATLSICPSCERDQKPHFYGPFANPSAAC